MEHTTAQVPVCTRIERTLAQEVGPGRYERYFRGFAMLDLDAQGLAVWVPSAFYASWLETKFGESLLSLARRETGRADLAVCFRVDPARFGVAAGDGASAGRAQGASSAAQEPAKGNAPSATRPRSVRHHQGPALRYSLHDFVVGACNKVAYEAALRLARGEEGFTSLFVHGECGVGKTHLLQGIAAEWTRARPGSRVRYMTGEAFTNEYIAQVRSGRVEAFRAGLRRLDLLCIDDVHFLSGKSKTEHEFMHTFDALGLGGARLAMASDHHPRDIQRLSEHLVSRCLGGAVIAMDKPDMQTRRAIVRRLALARGVRLDDGGVAALAASCAGSVRDLEGALTRVQAVARLVPEARGEGAGGEEPVAASVVCRALSEAPARRVMRPIKVITIARVVCARLGVDLSELLGRGRHKRVVLARSLTAYLARKVTTQSFPEIAQALNRPNHSTIVTAFQRVRTQIEQGAGLADYQDVQATTLGELCEFLRGEVLSSAETA